jgi:site-specific recombinase XerD
MVKLTKTPKIDDLIKEFLNNLKAEGKSSATIRAYEFHLSRFAEFVKTNNLSLSNFNGKQARQFRNYLVNEDLKPRSINAIISALKSFFEWALLEGYVKGNPIITRHLRVKEDRDKILFLKPNEVEALLSYLEKVPQHIRLAFLLMLYAGLRISEVVNLLKEDVYEERGIVWVHVRNGKGGKERHTPVLSRGLGKELLEYAKQFKEGERIFPVTKSALEKWARIIKEHVPGFRPHRLRHTFATRQLEKKIPIDILQEYLGHANFNTTRRNAKTLTARKIEEAKRLLED